MTASLGTGVMSSPVGEFFECLSCGRKGTWLGEEKCPSCGAPTMGRTFTVLFKTKEGE